MPLHPEYEALLKQMAEVGGPNLSDMPVDQGREMYRMMQPENPALVVGGVHDRKSQVQPVTFLFEFTHQMAMARFPSC